MGSGSQVQEVIRQVTQCLGLAVDATDLRIESDASSIESQLIQLGDQVGIAFFQVQLSLEDAGLLLSESIPFVHCEANGTCWVFTGYAGRAIQVKRIGTTVDDQLLTEGQFQRMVETLNAQVFLVAKRRLDCQAIASDVLLADRAPVSREESKKSSTSHRMHAKPFHRFTSLLRLDWKDLGTLVAFAIAAGILGLATPLAVEALVNVVSWGTYTQPLLVLAIILFACLGIAGVLRILQSVVTEVIQRRQLVRIVGDLAHLFPRANRQALESEYPREIANRFFDIMTLQKATAVLLLDGLTIVLTTLVGLMLLAFYHPFLLGFDIVLVVLMILITWLLGRGGVRTAIEESRVKYRIAHWLQDVISSPNAFKLHGGERLAVDRANRLTCEYLAARQRQFRVLLRQIAFSTSLQVVASTALLGLGGWLVVQQQLTLGQLVATELVVTVVVGAFSKAGKSIEQFYDAMAAVDKVGHLLDIQVDPRSVQTTTGQGPVAVRWESLEFVVPDGNCHCTIGPATISAGKRVALRSPDPMVSNLLLQALAGLRKPERGLIEVAGFEPAVGLQSQTGSHLGMASQPEIFHGTIHENVALGRSSVGPRRLREVLQQCGLWDAVLRLPQGWDTVLQTDGFPLTHAQRLSLCMARAMAGSPGILLVDGIMDEMEQAHRDQIWSHIAGENAPWTLLIATEIPELAARCDSCIELSTSETIS